MTKAIRIIPVLALFLVGFLAHEAFALNEILNVRHWVAPDHTRIVIDTSEVPDYTIETSKENVKIDFKNSVLSKNLPERLELNKPGVSVIIMSRLSEETVRIEISLSEHLDTNVFRLNKIEDKPDRVVVDIELPEVEKQEVVEREPVTRKKRIIVIDPGHGGEDPGAIGPRGTQEKDIVLGISRRLRDKLNKRDDYRAFLTRDGDYYVSFSKRLKIARDYGADLFISIHADAAPSRRVEGASVYCLSLRGASNEAARLLAVKENLADIMGGSPNGEGNEAIDAIVLNMFQTNTINTSKAYGQSILESISRIMPLKFNTVQSAPFRVLKLPEIPSLLVETGYISNKREEKLLRSRRHQAKIADAVADAILKILPAEPEKETMPPVRLVKEQAETAQVESASDAPKSIKQADTSDQDARTSVRKFQTYQVKRGDTLAKIAKRHNTTLAELLKLNNLRLEDPLFVGRKVKVAVLDERAVKPPAPPPAVEPSKKRLAGDEGRSREDDGIMLYRVKRGDTLMRIAKRSDTPLSVLMKMNNMKLKDPLFAGSMIKVKGKPAEKGAAVSKEYDANEKNSKERFVYHRVKRGETLGVIARRSGTTVDALRQLNRMKPSDPLLADQKLKLPFQSSL